MDAREARLRQGASATDQSAHPPHEEDLRQLPTMSLQPTRPLGISVRRGFHCEPAWARDPAQANGTTNGDGEREAREEVGDDAKGVALTGAEELAGEHLYLTRLVRRRE